MQLVYKNPREFGNASSGHKMVTLYDKQSALINAVKTFFFSILLFSKWHLGTEEELFGEK